MKTKICTRSKIYEGLANCMYPNRKYSKEEVDKSLQPIGAQKTIHG